MKLLPKKEIESKVNDQKKSEIDAGLFLARKIDALREQVAEAQKEHDETIATLNKEFQLFVTEMTSKKGKLENEIRDLKEIREVLQKPLDEAWDDFNQRNDELLLKQNKLLENEYIASQKKTELDKISEDLQKLNEEIKIEKSDADILLEKADVLFKGREEELKIAKKERLGQYNEHENKIRKLSEIEKEYITALQTLGIKKTELKEKESNLIIRERDLARRQQRLIMSAEAIKNNATNNS